jgi:hypothetical protein
MIGHEGALAKLIELALESKDCGCAGLVFHLLQDLLAVEVPDAAQRLPFFHRQDGERKCRWV